MKKKQKHPRLPSGFGSIRYLGGKRSRPYQVRAAAHMEGDQIVPGDILTYTDDWYKGFALLTAYNAHTWRPGDDIEDLFIDESEGLDGVVKRLLDDYRHITGKQFAVMKGNTFRSIMDAWFRDKYKNPDKREFAEMTVKNVEVIMKKLEPLYDRPISSLRLDDLQLMIDDLAPVAQNRAKGIISGVFQYAMARDLVDKDYSAGLRLDQHDTKNGTPFSIEEIKKLWKMRDDPVAEMLLIMIYSGFRISAYESMDVNLADRYFQGGVKTAAGRNRIVPIHPAILPLVRKRLRRDGCLIGNAHSYARKIKTWCYDHRMNHTAHHTRHTFSMLCEKYGVRENDRKRLLGHSFKDVTNAVYGHRDIEALRQEVLKIPICDNL